MKKYFILTSVLALTACGGGSGGGASAPVDVTVPSNLQGRVTATESNNLITGMKSEVIVSSNSTTPLSREATVTKNGITFKSYRLSDIKLYAADNAHTDNGYLQIGMNTDTGRIENINMKIGDVGAPVLREGETEIFSGPIFEYVESGSDQAKYRIANTGQTADDLAAIQADLISKGKISAGGHWNMVNEHMDVKTYGRDIDGNGTKLQYADFGHFNPVYSTKYKQVEGLSDADMAKARNGESLGRGSELDKVNDEFDDEMAAEDYQLFAGGYAIKGVALDKSLDVPRNTTYKGMAIGRVYTTVSADHGVNESTRVQKAEANGYSSDHDINKAFTTKQATMIIDANGNQTLYMPFNSHSDDVNSKFYDITVVKKANGDIERPTFSGTPTNAKHALHGAENHMVEAESSFNPGYYGVNTPSEAAGTARFYSEHDLGDGVQREYEIQAAYGMKKQ